MRDRGYTEKHLSLGGIFTKTERDNDYMPKNPSAEAQICLNCTAKKCKGTCERLREERKKIKEQQNER
jgi:hypothetical protein